MHRNLLVTTLAAIYAGQILTGETRLESLLLEAKQARDKKQWTEAERFGAEAIRMAESSNPSGKSLSESLGAQGLTYLQEGKYEQAEPLYLRAAAIGEAAGLDPRTLSETYYQAGRIQNAQDKRTEAVVSLQKALALREKAAGADSLDLCPNLRELAFALNGSQRKDEAINTFQRCLKIQQALIGAKKIDSAVTVTYIAMLFDEKGQPREAEEYYQKAISIHEGINGLGDSSLVPILTPLGDVVRRLGGRDKEAEELLRRALALNEKSPQPDVMRKAEIENNIALAVGNQGKFDEAENLLLDALDCADKRRGESALSSRILANLALVYLRQSRVAEAEKVALRALELREKLLKPNSPGLVSELYILARIYGEEQRFREASNIFRRIYEIQKQNLGLDHFEAANAARYLANSLLDEHQYSTAEELARTSLGTTEKRYGPDALETALSLECVGTCLRRQGLVRRAEPLYRRALSIREAQPSAKKDDLARSWNQFGLFLRELGNYREAISITQKAVGTSIERSRSAYLGNLAELYRLEGRYSAAETTLLKSMDLPDSETLPVHRLRRLGVLACALHHNEEGVAELDQSLKLAQKSNNTALTATILHDLANVNRESLKLDAADAQYHQALVILERQQAETPALARLHDDMGILSMQKKQFVEAEKEFLTAKRILEADVGNDSAITALSACHLAMLYRDQNRLFEAESLFRKSLEVQRLQMSDDAPILRATAEEYSKLLHLEHRDGEIKMLAAH